MGTPMYVSLDYDQYKEFEEQFSLGIGPLESSHTSVEGYYHKAVRFRIGDLKFEITGPMVMAPKEMPAVEMPPMTLTEAEDIARGDGGLVDPQVSEELAKEGENQ